jgi:hypothetical protein
VVNEPAHATCGARERIDRREHALRRVSVSFPQVLPTEHTPGSEFPGIFVPAFCFADTRARVVCASADGTVRADISGPSPSAVVLGTAAALAHAHHAHDCVCI